MLGGVSWLLSLGVFSDYFLQNLGPKILKVKRHGQIHHFAMCFPSPVVALNADLVLAVLQKSVQASTVLRKRCVRLRFVIRNGIRGIRGLSNIRRHLNFEPDMIQWRKTYVQYESQDIYSNFRLCCNSDP